MIRMNKLHLTPIFILLCGFLDLVLSIGVAPTWITSPFVQAATKAIITTKTGNSSTPTATLNFVNSFSSLPNIGYGIQSYEGDDFLGEQMFEVNRTGLTPTSFTVTVQIFRITNIWLMKVRYIAIDAAFPHKLNSFDNVPVNYSNGDITNISAQTPALTFYTNTINFTEQSIASGYSNYIQFSPPLSSNKILLFMTSMFQDGSYDPSPPYYPLDFRVSVNAMTNETYLINYTCETNVAFGKLHFSMIIFDESDVVSSGQYQLVYQKIDLPGNGGFVPIPQEFQTNFIMGLIQLQTVRTSTVVHFDLLFQTDANGVYGINMPQTTPRNNSVYAVRYGFTLFYMKTWICPNGTFFDLQTDLCETCSLYCQTCFDLTSCQICNVGYILNSSTGQCEWDNKCGDGVFMFPQLCDDGNFDDGDGCSPICSVESNYTCEPNSIPGMLDSVCFYVGEISMNVVYIEKIDKANQLEILLQIGPKNAKFWKNVDFSKMVTLSNMTGFQDYQVKRNSDGTVTIVANYNSTIHNMNITVELDPVKSGENVLSRYPPVSKDFQMIPTDNQLAVFYDNQVYQIANAAEILSYVVAAASLFFFLLGIFADKLVGVEMMAVIQISHLSLLTLPNLNPVFKTLANIWFVNGFNIFSLSKNYLLDPFTPHKVKGIYLFSEFFMNYNCTFLFILIPLLLSLVCLVLSLKIFNLSKREQIRVFAKRFACEYAFTGLMFSGYIISVSFALEILYGVKNMGTLISTISLIKFPLTIVLMAVYFVLKIIKPKHFGEYTQKFTTGNSEQEQKFKGKMSKYHYNCLIVERFVIGIWLVFMMDFKLTLLLPIFVYLIFVLESISLKPYTKLRHNVRFVCNMAISIVILIIYLVYNTTSQDSLGSQSKVWIYAPIVILILLLVCIIYSAVFILKSLMKGISKLSKNSQYNFEQDNKYFAKQNNSSCQTPKNIPFQNPSFRNPTQNLSKIKKELKYIRQSILKQHSIRDPSLFKNVDEVINQYDRI